MKILIDQNISFRLKAKVEIAFAELNHIRDFELTDLRDDQIFEYARQQGFDAVLTFDQDFHNLVMERGIPPKIIWLRTGNCRVAMQAEAILSNALTIQIFMEDPTHEVLEIYR